MTTFIRSAIVLGLFTVLAGSASTARADHSVDEFFHHIEEHADHVQHHSRDLYHEVRHELHGEPGYRHFLSDISEMSRLASRMRATAHAHRGVRELARDARRMDELMHHIEELAADVGRHASHSHSHFHGHRADMRQIRRLMRAIESDVHAMLDDVKQLERHFAHDHHHGISIAPSGVYVGGNGFSIRLGR